MRDRRPLARFIAPALFLLLLAATGSARARGGRGLSLEDRVAIEETIQRLYFTHQVAATRPFEEVIPRSILEKRVRTQLKLSQALEHYWKTPVTADALAREIERISRSTRFPERLEAVYRTLGYDPYLIQEGLARPVLVERLARGFFASDERIQGVARRQAMAIREHLLESSLDPRADHPLRGVVEARRREDRHDSQQAAPGLLDGQESRLSMSGEEYDRFLARVPRAVGEVGPVLEEPRAFTISVPLSRGADWVRVAVYSIRKVAWEDWWRDVSDEFDERLVQPVASEDAALPRPSHSSWTSEAANIACLPDDTWDRSSILAALPRERSDHTAVWTGSLMIVWGGRTGQPNEALDTGASYDPLTDTWTPISTINAPIPRAEHTAIWTGSLMVVWGGEPGGGVADTNTGGRYDPVSDTWTPTSTVNAPSARGLHTAVWAGDSMVVWGGYPSTDTGGRYEPSTDSWRATATVNAPTPRYRHTSVWTGSKMIVWGGTEDSTSVPIAGGLYDPATDSWSPTGTTGAPIGRVIHSAVWTGSRMIVWGGSTPGFLTNTGALYDPGTDSWETIPTENAPTGRRFHTTVWTGSEMVVWGGNEPSVNTGGRFDPARRTWTATSLVNAPDARTYHTGIWTGDRMLVWGGYNSQTNSRLNSGGRYDPATDSWTPTSMGNAPPAGAAPAVWTGSLMLIWGGSGPLYGAPGQRYDPLTDSWTPTSVVNAPEPAIEHTAVWTGSAVIVWGGMVQPFYSATRAGGRYDPVDDSWLPTSLVGAPLARYAHTAVWTGNQMVIWGGSQPSLNSGGRYDPVNDTWLPTSGLGAPQGRARHAAVWTGGEMVVWGGTNTDSGFDAPLSSGGRYNPAADTWLPTSSTNAPLPAISPSGVWTGSVLIVWGGRTSSVYRNTGGFYDPRLNSWTQTSTAGAPSPRSAHAALWTGQEMLVWGGYNGTSSLATGGRLNPNTGQWNSISNVNAPSARNRPSTVWSGSFMIVWGGFASNGLVVTNTGGRYSLGHAVDDDRDGLSECAGDCNDADPRIGAWDEVCDGLDNDCDGLTDGIDSDGDGAADACDCAPGDPTLFHAPPEVGGLKWGSTAGTLVWNSMAGASGSGTIYDVLRGLSGEWPIGGGASEVCRESGSVDTEFTVTDSPPVKFAYYYLVRARNTCAAGTYGTRSSGVERVSGACP